MSSRRIRYIWEERPRTQVGRARHDALIANHLDETSEPYFVAVRELLEEWIAQYPASSRPQLAGRLRSRDDDQFDSAFWELYLHEAYLRAGCSIEIEPKIPGTLKQPDFRIRGFDRPFYLEATSIRKAAADVAADRRLAQLHEALRSATSRSRFRVGMQHHTIGPPSVSGTRLVDFVQTWLETLDYEEILDAYSRGGITRLPRKVWREDGWVLEFVAFPGSGAARGDPLMVMWGPAEPSRLNYHAPILEAIKRKAGAYTGIDLPLVIAIQVNTEYHADDHHVERALYGLHLPHPPDGVPTSDSLQESGEGLWVGHDGYTRSHVPQVLSASNLHIGSLMTQPRAWPHPDPKVLTNRHPEVFAAVDLGPARVRPGLQPDVYFGFDEILCRTGGS